MSSSIPDTRYSLLRKLHDARDARAWQEFVGLYGHVLFRVARGRGLQPADAENLVQEVFLAVSQSIAPWLERDDRGSFRAWLLRIARHEAADLLTRRGKRPLEPIGAAATHALESTAAPDDVASQLDLEYERSVFQWAAEQVRAAVAPVTWQAFWLTHVEGLAICEAARRLETRPANIHFARSRVMHRIKELVENHRGLS